MYLLPECAGLQSAGYGVESVALEEAPEKPAHSWDECRKPQRDGLWPGEEARKIVHAWSPFLRDAV